MRKMKEITYYEMLEMARLGAGVMQPRSVEMGQNFWIQSMFVQLLHKKQVLLSGRNIQWKIKSL